ncbi:MAG: hypothetical protein KKC46_15665 [Proteobacteria bacterium]|nr:hypothetical protein [Pseudomonadota bacterium]
MSENSTGDKSFQSNTKDDFRVQSPAINLPKGGDAIRGIGEKFAANPVTGTGSMSVPIATSPGRSGFGPQLSCPMIPGQAMGRSGALGGFGDALYIFTYLNKSLYYLLNHLKNVEVKKFRVFILLLPPAKLKPK